MKVIGERIKSWSKEDLPLSAWVRKAIAHIESKPRTWFIVAIVGIALWGAWLRAFNNEKDYFQPDEQVAQAVVGTMSFPSKWDTNWRMHPVPQRYSYDQYNFSSYHYLAYLWVRTVKRLIPTVDNLRALRSLNVPLGVLSILLVGFSAARGIGRGPALFASALVAVCPLLVQDSHYARCDSMLVAGTCLLLWIAGPSSTPSKRGWFCFGLVLGWLFACKFSMVLSAPIGLAAFIERVRRDGGLKGSLATVVPSFVGVLIGLGLGVPFAFAKPHEFLNGISVLRGEYANLTPPYSHLHGGPVWDIIFQYLWSTEGASVLILGVVGIFYWARTYGWPTCSALILSVAVPLTVFGSQNFFAERNVSPVIPLIAVLAAGGVSFVYRLLRSSPTRIANMSPWIATCGAIFALALPLGMALDLVHRGLSLDDRHACKDYLSKLSTAAASRRMYFWTGPLIQMDTLVDIEKDLQGRPGVIAVYDFQDEYSAYYSSLLQTRDGAKVIAVRDSAFPHVPCCTLTTMVGGRIVVYLCNTHGTLPTATVTLPN